MSHAIFEHFEDIVRRLQDSTTCLLFNWYFGAAHK